MEGKSARLQKMMTTVLRGKFRIVLAATAIRTILVVEDSYLQQVPLSQPFQAQHLPQPLHFP